MLLYQISSNRLGAGGVPKILGDAGPPSLRTEAWLIPYKHAYTKLMLPYRISWLYVKQFGHNHGNPTRLLKSLKVIGTDMDRSAAYDFLLMIHRPISYRFRDKRKFFPPLIFNASPRELSLEFGNGGGDQKTTVLILEDGGKCLTICAFIAIQYHIVMERQTDRFALTVSRSACIWHADAR